MSIGAFYKVNDTFDKLQTSWKSIIETDEPHEIKELQLSLAIQEAILSHKQLTIGDWKEEAD